MKRYAQALLEGYQKLENMIEATDKKVLEIALCSSGYRGVIRETLDDVKSITDLTDKKIGLLKIAALVNDTITRLPYKYRQVAKFRYLKGLGIERTASLMGVSARTVYRLINDLPAKFAGALTGSGVTLEKLDKLICGQNWLIEKIKKLGQSEKTLYILPKKEQPQGFVMPAPVAAVGI